jgi:protein O-GlcNAc transferase
MPQQRYWIDGMAKLSTDQTLIRAKALERKGDTRGARELYHAVLRAFPDNRRAQQALAELGGAPAGQGGGGLQAAVDQLAQLYKSGQFDLVAEKAEVLVRQFPDVEMLWTILGAANMGLGRLKEAETAFAKTVELNPAAAGAHNNLGAVLREQGRYEAAIERYDEALRLMPDYAEVHCNRSVALTELGRFDEALANQERALRINPNYADAYYTMGMTLKAKGDRDAALESHQKALQLNPRHIEALVNVGNFHSMQRNFEEAKGVYERALQIKPNHVEANYRLGNALAELHDLKAAALSYGRVLQLQPDHVEVHIKLGSLLIKQKRLDEAVEILRQARRLDPGNTQAIALKSMCQAQMCDWTERDEFLAAGDKLPPFVALSLEDHPLRQKQRSIALSQQIRIGSPLALPERPTRRPARLRVGIFSADYREHPLMHVIMGLLREYDRTALEAIAYSYTAMPGGEKREEVSRHVDRFVDVHRMSDQEVVDAARRDGLDIAIDLTGYTSETRSRLFDYRLAPVQINFLGYASTMGSDAFDYIVADEMVIPPALAEFYTEKKLYLPNTYFPADNQRPISDRQTTRADHGLPEGGFVFCSFNRNDKIEPRAFDIWMRLLTTIEGSVLWLVSSNKWSVDNLRREAQIRGVDPDRLVFAGFAPNDEHLARHSHADLFIDTFSFNAHTTASDALWTGLPIVTRAGEQFAARVAASILTAAGLPDLVTETDEEYEALILALARDPARLATIRQRLAANRLTAPFFDTVRYTRDFEKALRAAYDRYFDGLQPDDIRVGRD